MIEQHQKKLIMKEIRRQEQPSNPREEFPPYIKADEYQAKIVTGDLIRVSNRRLARQFLSQGVLNVNAKMPSDAFVRPFGPFSLPEMLETSMEDPDLFEDDIFVGGNNRNRAFHGDIVGVELLPKDKWRTLSETAGVGDRDTQPRPTGKVVFIEFEEGRGSLRSYFCVLRSNRSRDANAELKRKHDNRRNRDNNANLAAGDDLTSSHSYASFGTEDDFRSELFVDWKTDPRIKAISLDRRIPWFVLPVKQLKMEGSALLNSPNLPEYSVYEVVRKAWTTTSKLPEGEIKRHLGDVLSVHVEEEMALSANNLLDHREPFSDEVEECAASRIAETNENFAEIIKDRVDLRQENIITIDPTTARDLDDAIHIKHVTDDSTHGSHFEIGVHIADVSHFVRPDDPTDQISSERTTTVYLPHRAFHMLPRALCEQVCSLNREAAKLTFSCVFYMTYDGRLIPTKPPRFFKSVIQSKYRLNYDEVQAFLDAERPDTAQMSTGRQEQIVYLVPEVTTDLRKRFEVDENDKYPLEALGSDLLLLEQITQRIRQARFDTGSMELNKVQLRFACDEGTSHPQEIVAEKHTSSHQLIEELMLMANRLVATKISQGPVGHWAVLRFHPALEEKKAGKVARLLLDMGIDADMTTSVGVHKTLLMVYEKMGLRVGTAIEQLMIECMQLAQYGCNGSDQFPGAHHFALHFDCYTHFTSPIRRYPDILVHRALALTLELEKAGVTEQIMPDTKTYQDQLKAYGFGAVADLQKLCERCNVKKEHSKEAQNVAGRAWLMMHILDMPEPPVTVGTVLMVQDKSFMVFVAEFDFKKRVEYDFKQGSDRVLQKMRAQYKASLPLPISYTLREDQAFVEIKWSEKQKLEVGFLSFVPVWVLPSRDVPMDFSLIPVPPDRPEYAAVKAREAARGSTDEAVSKLHRRLRLAANKTTDE